MSFGSRIRPDGLFAKSRYRCVPPIGVAAAHVFTHGCTDGEDPKGHKADRLPELLCDWDPSNEHDPAQLTYGMDVAIKWICAV